jgi:hypothetical protein
MTGADAFALRRQGRHDEALALSRTLYAADPDNQWNLNALRWSIHGVIKQTPDGDDKLALVREFMALPYSETDDYALKARAGYQKLVGDHAGQWQRAAEASKAGDWRLAMARYRELVALQPGDEKAETALAWELCRAIQHGLKEDSPDAGLLWGCVEEYVRLEAIAKPAVIHSRMLQWAGTLAKKGLGPKFCEFLAWWNPDANLRDEDREGRPDSQGGRYDSVLETAIAGVAKALQACENEAARKTAAEFIVKHAPGYPDRDWFGYYLACALLALGRREEAREPMIRLVRAKMAEFWAWEKLAATYPESSEERLQCLCRAVRCPCAKEAYWVGLHAELGVGLAGAGHVAEGRWHLEKALELRRLHGWSIPGSLSERLAATDGTAPADSRRVVEPLAESAEELLMEGIAARRGVLTGVNVELERDGEKRRFHFLCVEGDEPESALDCRVPANRAFGMLSGQTPGLPLSVRLDLSGPRPKVLSARLRPEGDPWDVMPQREGTVDHCNAAKGLAAVRMEGQRLAIVHFDRFPEAEGWKAGDAVLIRFTEKDGRIRVLAVSKEAPGCDDFAFGCNEEEEVPF